LAAQALAGIGVNGLDLTIGKRDLTEAEMRKVGDALDKAFASIFTNVFKAPMETALSSGALMLAQMLAGIGTNGVDLSSIIGKRDLSEAEMRFIGNSFADAMANVFNNVFKAPVENALSSGALMLAQMLAGIGTNGIDLSSVIGKRDLSQFAGRQDELRGFFDTLGNGLLNGLQSVWSNVLQKPTEQALQTTSLLAAQVLAGIGSNGVDLSSIFGVGKRELTAEARGPIFDNLFGHATGLVQTQVKPVLENAINNAILSLAGVLANFSQGGIGRR
jgi:hypothetical protein